MWETSKYLIIVFFLFLFLLNFSKNYYQFAVISELCWITLFTLISITSTNLNNVIIFSLPFIILTLTAVEASTIWSLILLKKNLY